MSDFQQMNTFGFTPSSFCNLLWFVPLMSFIIGFSYQSGKDFAQFVWSSKPWQKGGR